MTLYGAMQDFPLTTGHILDRMRRIYGDSEVVTLRSWSGARPGETTRASYAEVVERSERLSAGLASLGVKAGDRVATFAWNSQEHLEAYTAVPAMGAVLHTLNIRLFAEQLVYIANHAEDQVVIVDASLVEALEPIASQLKTVRHFIVMGDGNAGSLPNAIGYEELLASQDPGFDYPDLEESQAAGLCYTSGTTGNPKGVLYSHRSIVLHAVGAAMAESIGTSSVDRVLPIVPMFHANAWGLAHTAGLVGADLVMPGPYLQAEPLAALIESEQVTLAGGVPTVFMDLLRHADENEVDLSSLRKVACGGSAVPLSLMKAWQERHGVYIEQAWGMTEMSPLGTIARPPKDVEEQEAWAYRDSAGRVCPLVEARIVADDGSEVDWDGEATGELEVRGPWIAA
ncbi:MAG: AMP-binding protein, partial [Thermoleophilaceae bacterium]